MSEQQQSAETDRVAEGQVRAWDEHQTESCRRCGGPNVIWSAASPLWNYVMRSNDIDGEPRYSDLVCMACFIICATEAGRAPVSLDRPARGLARDVRVTWWSTLWPHMTHVESECNICVCMRYSPGAQS